MILVKYLFIHGHQSAIAVALRKACLLNRYYELCTVDIIKRVIPAAIAILDNNVDIDNYMNICV